MIELNWLDLYTSTNPDKLIKQKRKEAMGNKEAEKELDRVIGEFKPMEKERLDSDQGLAYQIYGGFILGD